MRKPRLVLLDEPTESIQPSIIIEIEEAIAQVGAAEGLSILLVEQFVEFALRLADRYVVLDVVLDVVASGDTATMEDGAMRRLLAVSERLGGGASGTVPFGRCAAAERANRGCKCRFERRRLGLPFSAWSWCQAR